MSFTDVTAEGFVGTNTAIVWSLLTNESIYYLEAFTKEK